MNKKKLENWRVGDAEDFLEDIMDKVILVWRWQDAPKEYRELSPHGGDEDWVAFVPASLSDEWIPWIGRDFGCCDISEHDVENGRVYIGAHA